MNEAAGFLRKDMSPKPAYERLMELVKGKWWTEIEGRTGSDGELKLRGFYGRYRVELQTLQGERRIIETELKRGEENLWVFRIEG